MLAPQPKQKGDQGTTWGQNQTHANNYLNLKLERPIQFLIMNSSLKKAGRDLPQTKFSMLKTVRGMHMFQFMFSLKQIKQFFHLLFFFYNFHETS